MTLEQLKKITVPGTGRKPENHASFYSNRNMYISTSFYNLFKNKKHAKITLDTHKGKLMKIIIEPTNKKTTDSFAYHWVGKQGVMFAPIALIKNYKLKGRHPAKIKENKLVIEMKK